MNTKITLELLKSQFDGAPEFSELQKFRFILIEAIDGGWTNDSITVIYSYDNKYYLNYTKRCSCSGYDWEPDEVTAEYIYSKYPDIDLNVDIFKDKMIVNDDWIRRRGGKMNELK